MRTIFQAAIAVFSIISVSPAMAGDGEGTIANTVFTQMPRVIAQAPAQDSKVAIAARYGDAGSEYVTESSHGTWLFPPHDGGGD